MKSKSQAAPICLKAFCKIMKIKKFFVHQETAVFVKVTFCGMKKIMHFYSEGKN